MLLLKLNRHLAGWRRRFRASGYWSLSGYVKQRIRRAADYIRDFEDAVVAAAAARGVDAVICGHIHVPAIRSARGIAYLNCGDWVESCSAIVEHLDGRFELVRWGGAPSATSAAPRATTAALAMPAGRPIAARRQDAIARGIMDSTHANPAFLGPARGDGGRARLHPAATPQRRGRPRGARP